MSSVKLYPHQVKVLEDTKHLNRVGFYLDMWIGTWKNFYINWKNENVKWKYKYNYLSEVYVGNVEGTPGNLLSRIPSYTMPKEEYTDSK